MNYNIIIVAPMPSLPASDGYSYYLMQRIKYFRHKNYKIYFYASSAISNHNMDLAELSKYCEELHTYEYWSMKKINVNYMLLTSIIKIIANFWLPLKVTTRLSGKMKNDIFVNLQKCQIDMILLEYPYLLRNIPREIDVPIILAQHNLEFNKMKKISKHHNFLKRIVILYESHKLKKYENSNIRNEFVSLYTFISKKNKETFEAMFNVSNTYLLPVGCDVHTRHQSEYQEGKIVFVGAMNALQNIIAIEWFVDKVFPEILHEFTDVKLHIIGKEPDKKILDLCSKNIIVTGAVDKIDTHILDAHLYIIPLVFGDGVKVKTLEAFSTGNIVVSTGVGVEGIEVIPNQDFILANTENEFIEACKLVLTCRKNHEHLAINASEKIKKHYSWDSILESYENKLETVVKQHKIKKERVI